MHTQGERAIGFAMHIMPRTLQEEETANPNYRNNLKESLVDKVRGFTIDLLNFNCITLSKLFIIMMYSINSYFLRMS